jgi:hypothetical protein
MYSYWKNKLSYHTFFGRRGNFIVEAFPKAIYYMSHQYCNKSKSQLTSPTPAQLPAVAVSTGHIVCSKVWPLLSIFDPNKQKTAILDLGLKSLNEGAVND